MSRVPRSVRCVSAGNPSAMTLDGTRIYLIGRDPVAVIDPGPARGPHLDRIEREVTGAERVVILLTHGHPDHAAAAPELARRTGGTVLDPAGRLGEPPQPGAVISTDTGGITPIPTPGHTPDHTAYHYLPADRTAAVIFVGDLLMGEGDTTLVAAPEGDIVAYLESLQRVRDVDAALLVPAHGPPLDDPEEAISRFRDHRLERIVQVRETLKRQRARSLPELRTAVYGARLPPDLVGAADASLRAILDYLTRTGSAIPRLHTDDHD